MPLKERNAFRWFLIAWMIAFTALTVWALVRLQDVSDRNRELIRANQARTAEIQEARLSSCRQTYEGIREVFRPFFPPAAHRTAEQRRDVRKFNQTIDRRKAQCGRQTGTE